MELKEQLNDALAQPEGRELNGSVLALFRNENKFNQIMKNPVLVGGKNSRLNFIDAVFVAITAPSLTGEQKQMIEKLLNSIERNKISIPKKLDKSLRDFHNALGGQKQSKKLDKSLRDFHNALGGQKQSTSSSERRTHSTKKRMERKATREALKIVGAVKEGVTTRGLG